MTTHEAATLAKVAQMLAALATGGTGGAGSQTHSRPKPATKHAKRKPDTRREATNASVEAMLGDAPRVNRSAGFAEKRFITKDEMEGVIERALSKRDERRVMTVKPKRDLITAQTDLDPEGVKVRLYTIRMKDADGSYATVRTPLEPAQWLVAKFDTDKAVVPTKLHLNEFTQTWTNRRNKEGSRVLYRLAIVTDKGQAFVLDLSSQDAAYEAIAEVKRFKGLTLQAGEQVITLK